MANANHSARQTILSHANAPRWRMLVKFAARMATAVNHSETVRLVTHIIFLMGAPVKAKNNKGLVMRASARKLLKT